MVGVETLDRCVTVCCRCFNCWWCCGGCPNAGTDLYVWALCTVVISVPLEACDIKVSWKGRGPCWSGDSVVNCMLGSREVIWNRICCVCPALLDTLRLWFQSPPWRGWTLLHFGEIPWQPLVHVCNTGGSRLRQIFWEHENLSSLSIIQLIQLL